jgi:hypothetical protein
MLLLFGAVHFIIQHSVFDIRHSLSGCRIHAVTPDVPNSPVIGVMPLRLGKDASEFACLTMAESHNDTHTHGE